MNWTCVMVTDDSKEAHCNTVKLWLIRLVLNEWKRDTNHKLTHGTEQITYNVSSFNQVPLTTYTPFTREIWVLFQEVKSIRSIFCTHKSAKLPENLSGVRDWNQVKRTFTGTGFTEHLITCQYSSFVVKRKKTDHTQTVLNKEVLKDNSIFDKLFT